MKVSEIREMNDEQLAAELAETRRELFDLRFQAARGPGETHVRAGQCRDESLGDAGVALGIDFLELVLEFLAFLFREAHAARELFGVEGIDILDQAVVHLQHLAVFQLDAPFTTRRT